MFHTDSDNYSTVTGEHSALSQRIFAFSLDQADSELPFSRRVARDNGWSKDYTWRVIEEYKRFAFLATVAGHPVTPSDPVDQVWHLHLTYSRSYWEDFCPHVLGKALHHEPARGGPAEQQKFSDWYQKTLASYERLLGHPPPSDIWPDPATRFGGAQDFVRINKACYWLIPKPNGGIETRAGSQVLSARESGRIVPADSSASGTAACGGGCGGCGGCGG
ncbi:MAG: glycine-rich domain-containing protein [Gammaproteobacteria bacterium]